MRALVAIGFVIALLITACGDDSDDETTTAADSATTTTTSEESTTESEETATTADGESDEAEAEPSETGDALTKAEYEAAFQQIGDEAEQAITEMQSTTDALSEGDFDAIGEVMGQFAALTGDTASKLDELEPPADIADEHQGYVDVLQATADEYVELADTVAGASGPEDASAAVQGLQELYAQPEIEQAVADFARAVKQGDYDLGFDLSAGQPLPGATP